MMKTFLIVLTLGLPLWTLAQATPAPVVVLDRYTVDADGASGRISVLPDDGSPVTYALEGKGKRRFALRDGRLYVKKRKASQQWWDVAVVARKGGQTFRQEFRLVRDAFVKNKVIAHRGAWKNTGAAQNSLGSLRAAIALGCEGSEFDVHLAADSVPVVFHDASVGSVVIDKTPSAELTALKLGNGETLPTLRDYLSAGMGQNRTKLILEIKPSPMGKERSLALTRKVVALVRQMKAQGWVDYISFDYDVLLEVLRLEPHAKVAYLTGNQPPAQVAADKMYGLDYHFSLFQKTPAWVREAQQLGLTVNTWTVNEGAVMDWLLQQGVDFITTDEPELLLGKVSRGSKE